VLRGLNMHDRHNCYYSIMGEVEVARKRRPDPKAAALRESRTLNPRPEAVSDDEFAAAEFFDARDLVQVKYEMVRRVRVDGQSVAASARAFGFSRPAFYAAARAVDDAGLAGLIPERPGPRRGHKLTPEVVAFAAQALRKDPALGTAAVVEAIWSRFGVRVHPRSVQRALARQASADKERKR
jgi:transposase